MSELKRFMVEELQVPRENFKGRETEAVAIEVMRAMAQAYQTVKMHLDVAVGRFGGGTGQDIGSTVKRPEKAGFKVEDNR